MARHEDGGEDDDNELNYLMSIKFKCIERINIQSIQPDSSIQTDSFKYIPQPQIIHAANK